MNRDFQNWPYVRQDEAARRGYIALTNGYNLRSKRQREWLNRVIDDLERAQTPYLLVWVGGSATGCCEVWRSKNGYIHSSDAFADTINRTTQTGAYFRNR